MDFDNNTDIIDSRDIIERISELESDEADATEDGEELSENDQKELGALLDLAVQAESSPDWEYGVTLIRGGYFAEYAEQYAEDIGAINADAVWPNNHIDWDSATDELKGDYFTVEYGRALYWIHS